MKKNAVLFVLFILPIVAYLFFASGINSFSKLPVVTSSIPDFGNWANLKNEKLTLNGKITVLGFGGTEILKNRGNLFNLNQKIYQRYHEFKDLQFIIVCPKGTEKDVASIMNQLDDFTNMSQWNFVFAEPAEITQFYDGLKISAKLDASLGTPNVYIIDKERNLRGRKGDTKFEAGYSTYNPSVLHNEMLDDFKIILYEYRAALKKNKNATRQI